MSYEDSRLAKILEQTKVADRGWKYKRKVRRCIEAVHQEHPDAVSDFADQALCDSLRVFESEFTEMAESQLELFLRDEYAFVSEFYLGGYSGKMAEHIDLQRICSEDWKDPKSPFVKVIAQEKEKGEFKRYYNLISVLGNFTYDLVRFRYFSESCLDVVMRIANAYEICKEVNPDEIGETQMFLPPFPFPASDRRFYAIRNSWIRKYFDSLNCMPDEDALDFFNRFFFSCMRDQPFSTKNTVFMPDSMGNPEQVVETLDYNLGIAQSLPDLDTPAAHFFLYCAMLSRKHKQVFSSPLNSREITSAIKLNSTLLGRVNQSLLLDVANVFSDKIVEDCISGQVVRNELFYDSFSRLRALLESAAVISEFSESSFAKRLSSKDALEEVCSEYRAMIPEVIRFGEEHNLLRDSEDCNHLRDYLGNNLFEGDLSAFASRLFDHFARILDKEELFSHELDLSDVLRGFTDTVKAFHYAPIYLFLLDKGKYDRVDRAIFSLARTGRISHQDLLNMWSYARISSGGLYSDDIRKSLLDSKLSAPDIIDCSRITSKEYSVLAKLGQGADGATYLVESKSLKSKMCIKVCRDMSSEAEIMALLKGEDLENIVQVHAAGQNLVHLFKGVSDDILISRDENRQSNEVSDVFAISMEYIEGKDLNEFISEVHELLSSESGTIPAWALDKFMSYSSQIFNGLQALRKKGIFHRDIRPKNIRITSDGSLKIVDFSNATTDKYAMPSKNRRYGGETDFFSLGLITYELVTGQHLIVERSPDMGSETHANAILEEKKRVIAQGRVTDFYRERIINNIPKELQDIILECLESSEVHRIKKQYESAKRELKYRFKTKDQLIKRILALEKKTRKQWERITSLEKDKVDLEGIVSSRSDVLVKEVADDDCEREGLNKLEGEN